MTKRSELPTVLLHGLEALRPEVEATLEGYQIATEWNVARPHCVVVGWPGPSPSLDSQALRPPVVVLTDQVDPPERLGSLRVHAVVQVSLRYRDLHPAVTSVVLNGFFGRQVERIHANRRLPEPVRNVVLQLLASDRVRNVDSLARQGRTTARTLHRAWSDWRRGPPPDPAFREVCSAINCIRALHSFLQIGGTWTDVAALLGTSPATLRAHLTRWSGRAPSELHPRQFPAIMLDVEDWLQGAVHDPPARLAR